MPENNNQDAEADLVLLADVVCEAGEIALSYFRRSPEVWLKTGNSPVTEADLAVDAFLKRKLLAARPDYGWISEETEDDRPAQLYRRFFVVDPIDGTRGFISQKSDWCISVAIVEDCVPVVGVLECPARKEFFQARTGSPALLNGHEIQVSSPGNPVLVSSQEDVIGRFPASFRESIVLGEHISSLACRLSRLSCGNLDVVLIRPGCHDWDIAAADIILRQGSGILADLKGGAVKYCQPFFEHGFMLATAKTYVQTILDVARGVGLS